MSGSRPYAEYALEVGVITAAVTGKHPGRPNSEWISDSLWELWHKCWDREPTRRPGMRGVVVDLLWQKDSINRKGVLPRSAAGLRVTDSSFTGSRLGAIQGANANGDLSISDGDLANKPTTGKLQSSIGDIC